MKRVDVRAVNSLFGTVDFLGLLIPDEASVLATAYGSDVTQYQRTGDTAYVKFGESYHVLAFPDHALDMRIVVRPGERDLKPRIRIDEVGVTEMGGHKATYYIGAGRILRRGKKHLFIVHYCDLTDRTIQIMFKGPSHFNLKELLGKVDVICHEVG